MKKDKLILIAKLLSATFIVAVSCGLVGTLFHIVLEFAAHFRGSNTWMVLLLPVAGLAIVFIYKSLKTDLSYGTVSVIKAVRSSEKISWSLAPSIFFGTFLTHIFGGSSGREGAALQLGGSLGGSVNKLKFFNFGNEYYQTIIMSGMSGLFSALFGTPLAAAVFVLSIINVKKLYKTAAIPCVFSSYISYAVAFLLGEKGVRYTIRPFDYSVKNMGAVVLISIGAAFASIVFCFVMENAPKISRLVKNEYMRIVVGGLIVLGLTILIGNGDYNGTGSHVIERAIAGEKIGIESFALKILFTAITLSFGFKGGEIVPAFFTGATFGSAASVLLSFDPTIGAAVGMMSVFCGVTNCPIATIIMSVEIFGVEYLPIFIPCCLLSFVFSGRHSLYGSRRLIFKDLLKSKVGIK